MSIQALPVSQVLIALGALAQESRLQIVRLLSAAGQDGLVASSIAERINMPPSTLSFHLKELSRAGLITSRQQGRFVAYTADPLAINGVLAYLTENCCRQLIETD